MWIVVIVVLICVIAFGFYKGFLIMSAAVIINIFVKNYPLVVKSVHVIVFVTMAGYFIYDVETRLKNSHELFLFLYGGGMLLSYFTYIWSVRFIYRALDDSEIETENKDNEPSEGPPNTWPLG
jgi:hypothetical protein